MSISPFVVLSAYGTRQSKSAVCAATVGAAGVATAAEGDAPAAGCPLPMLDPAAPVVVDPAVITPIAYARASSSGFGLGIGALLAGLVLVASLAAMLASGNNNNNNNNNGRLPIGPD